MKNEKFDLAVDEIVGFITEVIKLQMDQLKCNIRAVHEASTNEIDPNEIAQQIMNLPIESVHTLAKPASEFKNYKPPEERLREAESERSYRIISKDPPVAIGGVGDLADLSFVQNANETDYNKDFYHHCPEMQDDLVRLTRTQTKNRLACPVCNEEFEPK